MNGPSCQDKKHEKLHFVLIFRFGGNGPGIQCRKNQYKNGPFYHEQKEDNEELFANTTEASTAHFYYQLR